MSAAASWTVRATLVVVSTAAASGAAWWLWPRLRPEGETVTFVDDSAEYEALMAQSEARRDARGEEAVRTLGELGRELGAYLGTLEHEEILALSAPLQLRERTGKGPAVPAPGVLYHLRPSRKPHQDFAEHPAGGYDRRSNAQGWREDVDLGEKLGPRVLVIGDSHVEGVVANAESFPNVLEARRRARGAEGFEVWNAAIGSYGPAHYLGALTAYGDLDLDALVVTIYGGNDLREALTLWRLVFGLEKVRGVRDLVKPVHLLEGANGLLGQEVLQACYFAVNPGSVAAAEKAVAAMMIELDRQCDERGIAFLVVYLPPPSTGQPDLFGERLRAAVATTEFGPGILRTPDGIADGALARLAEESVAALDLRPAFARCAEPLYWNTDLHLNIAGHRLAAEAVDEALGDVTRR